MSRQRGLPNLTEHCAQAQTTQEVLAKMLGGGRPTLRRSLNSLAEIGAVALNYRRVSILDRGLLQLYKDEQ